MLRNINYIVYSIMLELEDMSTHRKGKLTQLAIKGFIRELRMSALPSVKAVYLNTNEINCIDFPKDYLYYTKIGVNIGNKIWTLTRNDNLVLTRKEDECGMEYRDVAAGNCSCSTGYPFVPFWNGATWNGGLYGVGGGINSEGYYRIDFDKQRIQFDNRVPQTQILLEYVSSGVEPDGNMLVPEEAVNCLIAYVHWQNIMHNRRIGRGEKQDAKKNWEDEYQKMVEVINPFRLDEYLDQKYEAGKQSPKR
jgi:hypothetical protein